MYESSRFEALGEDNQPVRGRPDWSLVRARNERSRQKEMAQQAAVRLAARRELAARVHEGSRSMWAKMGLLALVPVWVVAAVVVAVGLLLGGCARRAVPVTGATVTATAGQAAATVTRAAPSPAPTMTATAPVKKACDVFTAWLGPDRMSVNVRGGPGMEYAVVDVVYSGEELILTGRENGGWSEVTTPKLVTGWFYCSQWCECNDEEGVAE